VTIWTYIWIRLGTSCRLLWTQ